MQIISWSYNGEKDCVEFIVEQDGTAETLILDLPEAQLIEMSSIVPAIMEKAKMKEMLNEIYRIEKEQLLSVEALSKKMDELDKQHEEVREELSEPDLTKEQVLAYTAKSKDLVGVKALFTEKRHMIKLLAMKAAEYRTKLAKMQAGYL